MKETLKFLREHNRYSQTQIASMVGISRQMYIKYENGEYEPGVKTILSLCKIYGVPYQVIIENKYCDGIPDKNEYEIDSYSSETAIEEPSFCYEAKPDSVKTNNVLDEINELVKQLGISDRLKLISELAEKIRMEQDAHRRKYAVEKEQVFEKMSYEDSLAVLQKMTGCIKNRTHIDVKTEKKAFLDEKYGLKNEE